MKRTATTAVVAAALTNPPLRRIIGFSFHYSMPPSRFYAYAVATISSSIASGVATCSSTFDE